MFSDDTNLLIGLNLHFDKFNFFENCVRGGTLVHSEILEFEPGLLTTPVIDF